MKDIRNHKTIKEGDGAAHLRSAVEDAQIYFDGIREDGHVYAQLYGIPIDEVSQYFRKLLLLPNSNNQNMELTEFNRSLSLHAVGGPSWLPGSQWSSQSWLYFKFKKAPEHVDSVRFPSGDNKNVSVIRMRQATQSTTKSIRRAFPVMQSYCWGNDRLRRGITMFVTLSIFFSGKWAGQWTDILGLTLIRDILNWRRIGGDLTVKGMMYPNGQATLL